MSSLELSDEIYSSEDEDVIIRNMESTSGLPDKHLNVIPQTDKNNMKLIHSETAVATVKMTGTVKHGHSLYDSSESEGEEIMRNIAEHKDVMSNKRTNSNVSWQTKLSNESRSSSVLTEKSFSTSLLSSSETVVNGTDELEESSKFSFNNIGRSVSVSSQKSVDSADYKDRPPSYTESRFNPFDKDMHMDEDHFDITKQNLLNRPNPGRLKSDSMTSSSWTDPSLPESNEDDITFADLGLTEDHYSQPEGYFGMTSTEELEMAIETCKDMIVTAQTHSDKQKNLVRKLVQLRLKLQELKEGPEPIAEGVKVVVGHKFVLNAGAGSKRYCEKCNGLIWGGLQQWYQCSECGYSAHEKCLNQITRTCAIIKVQEDPTYCLDICPEKGLSAQNYRCAECRAQISFKSGYSEPRLCDYSGNFFCELCHWNDNILIPARVLHNWDFDEWKVKCANKLHDVCGDICQGDIMPNVPQTPTTEVVSRAAKQFLKLMESRAVIRIQDVNPMLFSFVEELNDVKKLREELLIMKRYILLCAKAMEQKLLLQLQSRQHFVESSDIYSMRDLVDVHKDILLPEIAQVHSSWAQHIKTDCERCRARGFICELCDMDEILFPFDSVAVVCSQCSYVQHKHCFAKRGGVCPRCERRTKRKTEEIPDS